MPECQKTKCSPAIEECQPIPQWLTKDYFEDKLRTYYNDTLLEVNSFTPRLATAKGDNYASIMTRVTVQYTLSGNLKQRTKSYIVKSSFEDEFSSEKMKPYEVFNREMEIYESTIPKINALLSAIGKLEKMFPSTISVDNTNEAIIFEDLTEAKYVPYDRLIGLDMAHIKLCLKKLAYMHAATAVINEREPGIFHSYDRGLFNRHTTSYSPFFVGVLDACGRLVSQWEDYKHYGKKLMALKPKLMEYGAQVFDPIDGHLNVMAHGDFWVNNVMFRYDGRNQVEDVLLFDFQYSCWGSPAIDLHYIFNTSLKEDLRLHHQDELFQYYYIHFSETLRDLNFKAKIPSLHEFLLCMAEKSFYAFTSSCLVQPVMINEDTVDADFCSLMGEDERAKNFKNGIYKNEKVQKNLKRLLPYFDRKGLLDHRD